jgi:hypothetical protein
MKLSGWLSCAVSGDGEEADARVCSMPRLALLLSCGCIVVVLPAQPGANSVAKPSRLNVSRREERLMISLAIMPIQPPPRRSEQTHGVIEGYFIR